jgi:hypothetical protein
MQQQERISAHSYQRIGEPAALVKDTGFIAAKEVIPQMPVTTTGTMAAELHERKGKGVSVPPLH